MALHPDFPSSPHAILEPDIRWFPADETRRENTMDKLMPPLVYRLRRKVKEFREGGYTGAAENSVITQSLTASCPAPWPASHCCISSVRGSLVIAATSTLVST